MLDHMPQHPVQHRNPQKINKRKSPWRCHYCGRHGHIRSYYYRLYGYPHPHVQPKVSGKIVQARKEWKPKTPTAGKRKTPNVSSSVTSSMSIGVPPVLTESENLAEFVHGVNNPHPMSNMYVKPLKNPNVEPNVDNIIDESVLVTPSRTIVFDPLSAPSKNNVVGPLKETLTQPDVTPNVTTSLVQPDQIESKSTSDNEKSQSKMVTDHDEEEKVSNHEDINYVSVGDEKDGSEGDDQSV